MNPRSVRWTALLGLLLAAAPLHAEGPRLLGMKVGLADGRSRNGAWAPVAVDVESDRDTSGDAYRLVMRCTDSEDVAYQYIVPVPALEKGKTQTVLGYLRPGNLSSDFSVVLQTADGKDVPEASLKAARGAGQEILAPRDVLVLTLGARLPGLKRALSPRKPDDNQPPPPGPAVAEDPDEPSHSVAAVEEFERLPDRWFGYEAADVVVLASGKPTFVNRLLTDQTGRREALVEWVRRGGKLVLSIGVNREAVAALLQKMPVLPGAIGQERAQRKRLEGLTAWSGPQGPRLTGVELTELPLGGGVMALVSEPGEKGDARRRPILVQTASGVGRVIVVGFDLDAGPFVKEDFREGQRLFWVKLLDELDVRLPGPPAAAAGQAAAPTPTELLDHLQQDALEQFGDELPTVPFGWVALFILLYIAVVGPLDYFILKKVFKRLELTWVTFPIVVVVVSVAAYWTAYALKGEDMCINQVDVIEYDLRAPQAYGRTWLTLFSPRIQNYTVGVAPAAGWAAPPANTTALVTMLESPARTNRQGSAALFRQPYTYAENATAVERMPVPVWATRSFTASWRAPLDPAKPAFEASLKLVNDKPTGSITSNLPVPLMDVVVFYKGQWRDLKEIKPADPVLRPGQPCNLAQLFAERINARPVRDWCHDPAAQTSSLAGPARAFPLLRDAMFYSDGSRDRVYNSGLRSLNQSWRLRPLPTPIDARAEERDRYADEVIVVGRTGVHAGKALKLTEEAAAPTRLNLDPPLTGYLTQEAVVRVYVPLVAAK
jgi:hypothetical protein